MTVILCLGATIANFAIFLNFQTKVSAISLIVPLVMAFVAIGLDCSESRSAKRVSLILVLLISTAVVVLALKGARQFGGGYWFVGFEFLTMALSALTTAGDAFGKEKQQ